MRRPNRKLMTVLLIVLAIAALTFSGCKKNTEEEENANVVGNTPEIADTETDYSDAATPDTNNQVGNSGQATETGDREINYIDQKAEGDPNAETDSTEPESYPPVVVYDAQDIPEGSYAIAHPTEDGTIEYYLVYVPYGSYYVLPLAEGGASVQPERFAWTTIGYDDTTIPTMHAGDTLVYKSADTIPEYFNFERYSDEGYTIGVANLIRGNSGNYLYDLEQSYVNEAPYPISDTQGLKNLGAGQVYIVSVGNVRVSPTTVSETGTVKGLKRNENYICDVRTGTESITAAFRATSHLFVSLEQYKTQTFYFSAKHTIEIGIEPTTPTGYYNINNSGFFRYIAPADEGKTLTAADYNKPFITINVDGKLVSTVDGYAIDEQGFIVKER